MSSHNAKSIRFNLVTDEDFQLSVVISLSVSQMLLAIALNNLSCTRTHTHTAHRHTWKFHLKDF